MDDNALLQTAIRAFEIETDSLIRTRSGLGPEFVRAVRAIADGRGKLIVTGIGKSAHVGNKIVATLNSTGTPSQFVHAAEAIHGDLGAVAPDDVVLCISNSGNSPEIVNIAPILKKYGSKLIAMTGNLHSRLAEQADIVLDSSVEKEACPNRLAPTSSTTVQMVLGDALAVCLMELKGFKQEDFARFHPGGALGKNLTATVGLFLSENKPEVNADANIREIIISISGSRHGITVVTEGTEILGVITDGDLRRMLLNGDPLDEVRARDVMSRNPRTVEKTAMARDAMATLKRYNIGQLVVTDQGSYSGIIDLHKLLDEGING